MVCHNRLLKGDLRAICKAGHHMRLLAPLLCKTRLGGRVTVGILQSLDVSADQRLHPNTLDVAPEVDLNTRLVAITARQNHAGIVRIDLQNRSDRRIQLGIHHHNRLAVRESIQEHTRRKLNRARDFDQNIDVFRSAEHMRIGCHTRNAGIDGGIQLSRGCHMLRCSDARFGIGLFSPT